VSHCLCLYGRKDGDRHIISDSSCRFLLAHVLNWIRVVESNVIYTLQATTSNSSFD
jgi:hypothetical protein